MIQYFISDLHLSPASEKLAGAFLKFMDEHASKADELYILGDFFDAWIGDDEDNSFYAGITAELRAFSDKGLRIKFCHGNRDFLIGERFAEAAGLEILNEETLISAAGKRVLLMHGDSLCTTDSDYMAFRTQVRNPQWQAQILGLPLEQRRQMAQQLRAQSKSMNSNKAEDIMDVNPDDVQRVIENHHADILLHGHTHRPNTHDLGFAERIVLGDWGEKVWYVAADDKSIKLQSYSIK